MAFEQGDQQNPICPQEKTLEQVEDEAKRGDIGPTAMITLDCKNYPADCGGSIPYANAMANSSLMPARLATETYIGVSFNDLPETEKKGILGYFVPGVQARYLSTLEEVLKANNPTVIELAPGFTPRGLHVTDPKLMDGKPMRYLGLDLERVVERQNALVNDVRRSRGEVPLEETADDEARLQEMVTEEVLGGEKRAGLEYKAASALSFEELNRAISESGVSGPITIVHEGLLPYFEREGQAQAVDNIHKLLEIFGGTYVNGDIIIGPIDQKLTDLSGGGPVSPYIDRFFRIFNVNKHNISFETLDKAIAFFDAHGFKVEVKTKEHLIDQLHCIEELGLDRERIEKILSHSYTFVLTLKDKPENQVL
jgi:hypothetical protein